MKTRKLIKTRKQSNNKTELEKGEEKKNSLAFPATPLVGKIEGKN